MQLIKSVRILLGLVALSTTSATFAQVPTNLRQAITLEQYRLMPQVQREVYVAGVLDADRVFYEQTKPMFAACLNGVTIPQVTAVVDASTKDVSPAKSNAMPVLVHNSLILACDRAGFKLQ
ncbi:hypothetical protein [Cupriavidus sp. CP313]